MKKSISLILAVLLLASLLAGCGGDASTPDTAAPETPAAPEESGLVYPRLIDEWTEVLTAFKTAYTGAEDPLDMCGTALQYSNYFCGAYDVASPD